MKKFAIRVLAGPVLMAVICALGMPAGYYFGFIASCVILPIVAIVAGVLLAKITEGMTAGMAVFLALIPGLESAYGFHAVRELRTGAFVTNVALADLPALRGKDRLTLREGEPHRELSVLRSERTCTGVASDRTCNTEHCEVYPIAPAHWTPDQPVTVWRFGDTDFYMDHPWPGRVFHPSAPDALCRKALDLAIAKHHLRVAQDAVYLEELVDDSADVGEDQHLGVVAVVVLSFFWIAIVLYLGARDLVTDWFERRRERRGSSRS